MEVNDGTRSIESWGDVKELLGSDVADDIVSKVVAHLVELNHYRYWYDYSENPLDTDMLVTWIDKIREHSLYTSGIRDFCAARRGIYGKDMPSAKVLETSLLDTLYEEAFEQEWFLDWEQACREDTIKDIANELNKTLRDKGVNTGLDDVDDWVDFLKYDDELKDVLHEKIPFDYGFENLLDTTVHVDIFLTHGDEWNTDYTSISSLADALVERSIESWDAQRLRKILNDSALGLLIKSQGTSLDDILHSKAPSAFETTLRDQLNWVPTPQEQVTVCCDMSVRSWIGILGAQVDDQAIRVSCRRSRDYGIEFPVTYLYDRHGGSGTNDIRLDKDLCLPASCIDLALPDDVLEKSNFLGFSVRDCYQTSWEPWSFGDVAVEPNISKALTEEEMTVTMYEAEQVLASIKAHLREERITEKE